jgi:hypothetical protein
MTRRAFPVALCMVAVCASTTSAASRGRLIATTVAPAVTDGVRYAAYVTTTDELTVVDTRTGRSRTVPHRGLCIPADASHAAVLVTCNTPSQSLPFILDARTGALTQVPGAGTSYDPNFDGFGGIGARWLFGNAGGRAYLYVRWRDGATRFGGFLDSPLVPRDLDSPTLRALGPADSQVVASGRISVTAGQEQGSSLVLHVRGRPPRVLDHCPPRCSDIQLGGGVVTWQDFHLEHAYEIRTGRRAVWRFASARHVAAAMFFSVALKPLTSSTYHVYEAPLSFATKSSKS